jgi:hypothetical protein
VTDPSREPATARAIIMSQDRPPMKHCDRCRKGQRVFERRCGWAGTAYTEMQLVCGVCNWVVETKGFY